MKNQGYFIAAINEKYCELSKSVLIPSIRKFDREREITVLTDLPSQYNNIPNVKTIEYNHDLLFKELGLSRKPLDNYERYGAIPRLSSFVLSEYDETFIMDVDMVFLKDPAILWEDFSKMKKDIVTCGISDKNNNAPTSWHWGKIKDVQDSVNFPVPQIGGGFFYSNKNNKDLLEFSKKYWDSPSEYGIRSQFRGAVPCEVFIAMYMGNKGIRPVEFFPYIYLCDNDNIDEEISSISKIKDNYNLLHFIGHTNPSIEKMRKFLD